MATEGRYKGREAPALKLHVPSWGPSGELPVLTRAYHDGELRWYGSGMAVADVRELPITIRMPYVRSRDRVLWLCGSERRQEMTMALRKVVGASQAGGPQGPGVADAGAWPHLLEYLQSTKYPDGSAREPSCLIIVAESGGWRGCVSDKDNSRTLWKTADTVEGLLLALEQALAEDDPSAWRQSGGAKWKGKKKG